jgi:hypothetical protein
MDQSNEEIEFPEVDNPMPFNVPTSDEVLRATAINWGLQVAHSLGTDALTSARGFYLFVTGRDPVVDVPINSDCTNVVFLNH